MTCQSSKVLTLDNAPNEKIDLQQTCIQLTLRFQRLCDNYSLLQKENNRFRTAITDILECFPSSLSYADESAPAHCERCEESRIELRQLREHCERIEYMTSYTQELAAKNDMSEGRVRCLEQELAEERRKMKDFHNSVSRRDVVLDQLTEDFSNLQQQLTSCQEHMTQLNRQVNELVAKNVELEIVNKHQKCLLADYQSSCTYLRSEILQSCLPKGDNS